MDAVTAAACAACVDAQCCDEATACGADAECLAGRNCYATCALYDTACNDACAAAHPDGLEVNRPYTGCRNTACADACRPLADWSCLGMGEAPVVSAGEIQRSFKPTDFVSGAVYAGITIKVCALADVECASPLSTGLTTNEGGTVTVPVGQTGFEGYFELTGADMVPTIFFANPALRTGNTLETASPVDVLSTSNLDLFAQFAEVTIDAGRGQVGLRAIECFGAAADGIAVTASNSDADSKLVYLAGGLPDLAATVTDASGVVGIFNLAPGQAALEGRNAAGQAIDSQPILVRAGFLTTTNLNPLP